ncbi:membrane-bound PQQ-dependent dehydrogenase, glucose/quinate/shikimate family [Sphingobium sp. Sx8-8]|uniref:membrane-bound PQQ-dependent dehydrogenase, glucose/quinate/shikimate family n=1 Tax=Sphingobium sp. Sx8-8 TaxID=2933617 RepID=UPI0032AEE485
MVLGTVGLAMLVGGVELARLGGSVYYACAGGLIIASALLLLLRRRSGAWLYAATVMLSIIWAIWEVGFSAWLLLPRLLVLVLFGLWLLLPWSQRPLLGSRFAKPRPGLLLALGIVTAVLIGGLAHAIAGPTRNIDPRFQAGSTPFPTQTINLSSASSQSSTLSDGVDWPNFGGDSSGSRYSPLDQITPDNVGQLKVAWVAHLGTVPGTEATPIKIGDSLYTCNNNNEVFALDATTGRQRWTYDASGGHGNVCRGVAYFRNPAVAGQCAERILTATATAKLIALDARTGRPCPDFGTAGVVDLRRGLSAAPKGYYRVTSAPTMVRGKVVIGGWITDGQYWGEPSGVVRAFDATTGDLVWAWDMGRPDRVGLPPAGEHYTPATPNSWAPMSADESLGMVYVPTGNATPDYFGAQRRPFDDQFSSSVVALDARTGRVRWSFQTVHHDLWDRDVPAQPTLVDLPIGGQIRRALVQATKQGDLYVLDRVTGRPIHPVTEVPMPSRGGVPEERPARTQPLSNGMPSFRGPRLREVDMWGVTPLDQLYCRIEYRKARYDSDYTHPGLTPSILYPSSFGAINWGSVSVDKAHAVIFVNSNRFASYLKLVTRAESDRLGFKPQGDWGNVVEVGAGVPQKYTPYGVDIKFWLSPIGVPCNAPPYGHLSAVDLVTGKLIWTQEFGTARGSAPLGLPQPLALPLGALNHGGSVVTRTGLLFIGASKDGYMRAFDSRSGRELWRADLPGGGQATPLIYSVAGREYVVISAGGTLALQTKLGTAVVAFSLPEQSER